MNNLVKITLKAQKKFTYLNYLCDVYFKTNHKQSEQSSFAFIREIVIENNSDIEYKNLKIIFSASNSIIEVQDIYIDALLPNSKIKVSKFINTKINVLDLYKISEACPCQINLSLIEEENGEEISSVVHDVVINPISDSIEKTDNVPFLSCFVTPNAVEVDAVAAKACNILKKIRPDQPAFIGYQANDIDSVRQEMMAIYNALNAEGIAYSNPPASFNQFQRIRTPSQVLNEKRGTCLDLALLYCAVLECVDLKPILVIINGHAFAGCFLNEMDGFENTICNDVGRVFNASAVGNMKIELVECTGFPVTCNMSFNDSSKTARKHIQLYNGYFSAIDIHQAHLDVYRPIPTIRKDSNGNESVDIKPKEDLTFENKKKEYDGKIFKSNVKEDKFSYWSRKLLDLTLRNKLINFSLRASAPQILVPDVGLYIEQIINNQNLFFVSTEENKSNEILDVKGDEKFLSFARLKKYSFTGNEKTYKSLIRASNSSIEETGSNVLYLTIGLMDYAPKYSKRSFLAPIFLIPVKGKSKSGPYGYEVNPAEDEITINTTVFEFLKQNYGVSFDELYHVTGTDILNNYNEIFNAIRNKTSDECSILVEDDKCFLSTFSFAHYIMWDDINNRKEELMKNEVIKSFVNSTSFANKDEEDLKLSDIDRLNKSDDIAIPLGADSSQIKAIIDCAAGESFVLDGPPGTGKSQTIVNMIANAMYKGKTVLFVAEKMAALDVVKKRIDKLSLGTFCLEMHSNKANKKDVLAQIGKALECGRVKSPEEFAQTTLRLDEEQKRLNVLVEKINKSIYGISLHDAIIGYEELKDYNFDSSENFDKAYTLSNEDKKRIYEEIDNLKMLVSYRGDYYDNPFREFNMVKFDVSSINDLVKLIQDLLEAVTSLENAYHSLEKLLLLSFETGKENFDKFYELVELMTKEKLFFKHVIGSEYKQNHDTLLKVIKLGEEINSNMKILREYFNDDVLEVDAGKLIRMLEEKNSFKHLFNKISVKKALKKHLKDKSIKLPNNLIELITLIKHVNDNNELIKQDEAFAIKLFDQDYLSNKENYALVEHYVENIDKMLSLFDALFNKNDIEKYNTDVQSVMNAYQNIDMLNNRMFYDNYIEKYLKVAEIEKVLTEKYQYCDNKIEIKKDYFFVKEARLKAMLNDVDKVKDIASLNKVLEELRNLGMYDILIKKYYYGDFPVEDFKKYFDMSCYASVIKKYFEDPYYTEFNGLLFTQAISRYKDILNEYSTLMIEKIANKVTKNYPITNANYAESSSVFKLQKLVKNNGYKTSIRNILSEFEDLIRTLCPCFLMSPLSAAQYLSVNNKKFDIVIFDEASQIPTAESVGAISRGKSLIVAGDPEQMPPTNFFKASLSSDEDYVDISENYDDLESLLDDCLALGIKRNRLLWHYRSQHESLIAFSNNTFYDHQLFTFPTPDNNVSRVEYQYVKNAVYENGKNLAEANAIFEEVKRRFEDPKLCHKSIGIVTFNMKQQEIIQDKINDFFDRNPKYAEININNEDQLFVKNLENVQGDERDVIIFSIGFGYNKNNKFSMMFGPLSLDKGERRLNVAVTRAREQMIVYASIHGTDINSEKAKNNGADVLKQFLLFAENGMSNIIVESSQQTHRELGIEEFICNDLTQLGYSCDKNVGDSKFKVDVAVKNKDGQYILGIICDSESYLSSPMCRDRNYVQVNMLNRLKWKIIRVYTLDYFNDKRSVIKDIVNAIEHVENIDVVDEEKTISLIDFDKEEIQVNKRMRQYNECRVNYVYDYNCLGETYYPDLIRNLESVIDYEGPICTSLLLEKFKVMVGVSKSGSRVKKLFSLQMSKVNRNRYAETFETMYYPLGITPERVGYYRVKKDEIREITAIPLPEIKNVLLDVLELQGKILFDDCVHIVLNTFGYRLVTNVTQSKAVAVINQVLKEYSLFELIEGYITIKK